MDYLTMAIHAISFFVGIFIMLGTLMRMDYRYLKEYKFRYLFWLMFWWAIAILEAVLPNDIPDWLER